MQYIFNNQTQDYTSGLSKARPEKLGHQEMVTSFSSSLYTVESSRIGAVCWCVSSAASLWFLVWNACLVHSDLYVKELNWIVKRGKSQVLVIFFVHENKLSPYYLLDDSGLIRELISGLSK